MATSLRMTPEVELRYNALAKATGRSKSFYLNEALNSSIDRLEYEYGLLQKVEQFRTGRLETVSLDELEDSLDLED